MAIDPTIQVFPFQPDGSDIVNERLEFFTDAIPSWSGEVQTRSVRLTPRRSFEFLSSELADAARWQTHLAWNVSAKPVYLPIWPGGAVLETTLGSGATEVPVDTAWRDFTDGGIALLRNPEDPRRLELLSIDTVEADHLVLTDATANGWPAGSLLLAIRRARLDQDFTTSSFNRGMQYGRQRFVIDEANPYPAIAPATTYRAYPVITDRPSFSADPVIALERQVETVDDSVSLVAVHDPVGIPLYRQEHDWTLDGLAAVSAFRSMAYAIRGARNSVWMPTWRDDLQVAAAMTSAGKNLDVRRCGYADLIAQAINRRDLRIELTDGTVLYRRITASSVLDDATERLVLDTAPGRAIAVDQVAQISFMALCRSDSDIFEFAWWKGTYADIKTAWRARKHDI